MDEGNEKKYAVVLDTEPSADVTVGIALTSDSGTDVTLTTASENAVITTSLTFTNLTWNTPQEVTVSAAEDGDAIDEPTTTIEHTVTSTDGDYSGISAEDVTVEVTENDYVGVKVVPTSLRVGEGGSNTYKLVLGSEPSADVTVGIALTTGLEYGCDVDNRQRHLGDHDKRDLHGERLGHGADGDRRGGG